MRAKSPNLRYNILDDILKHPSYGQDPDTEKIGFVQGPAPEKLTLSGNGNNRPRQEFANSIATLSDDEFVKRSETIIWLSAYADNNPASDYHWQADACYYEALRRGKPEIYTKAFERASSGT